MIATSESLVTPVTSFDQRKVGPGWSRVKKNHNFCIQPRRGSRKISLPVLFVRSMFLSESGKLQNSGSSPVTSLENKRAKKSRADKSKDVF